MRTCTRSLPLLALVALVLSPPPAALAAGTDASTGVWPMFRYDPAHTGYNPTETTLGTANVGQLAVSWTGTTSGQTNLVSSPVVGGGEVVVGSIDGTVYAFGATDGAPLWSVRVASTPIDTSPAVSRGAIFVGTCDTLYALRGSDGSSAWSTTLNIPGPHGCDITSPTVSRGRVFVGSYGSKGVHAFRGSDGTLLWSSVPTGGPVESSPAVAGGLVYAGSDDGSVYAYPVRCSDPCPPRWSFATGDMVQGAPAVANGLVYVGSLDGNLYAIDATNGHRVWQRPMHGQVIASPAVAGGVVYAAATGGDLSAFDALTGAPLWGLHFAGGTGSPAVANGVLYLSASGNVEAFDAATGGFLWDGFVVYQVSSPAVTGGMVFANAEGVSTGTLWAWGLH